MQPSTPLASKVDPWRSGEHAEKSNPKDGRRFKEPKISFLCLNAYVFNLCTCILCQHVSMHSRKLIYMHAFHIAYMNHNSLVDRTVL
jgi:hypothetical protein